MPATNVTVPLVLPVNTKLAEPLSVTVPLCAVVPSVPGMSAAVNRRNVGAPAAPLGAAKCVFAV